MNTPDSGFVLWYTFRIIFISLLFIYLLFGLDDLLIDIVYYSRLLWRRLFRRNVIKPLTREDLAAEPEKPIAIMIPAWQESNVIQRMLLNTAGALDYRNTVVFVGTYPNDEATALEAGKAREVFPNIEIIVTPADGPTNKADCLNWIFQGIRIYEKKHNLRFEAFLMHDAEDIIHPLWPKLVNHLMPKMAFIQLPVFPLDGSWSEFVGGVYRDEFAENHTKDMRVREVMSISLPSAGVGTALSRQTVEWLAEKRKNQIFDITSIAEDYLLGIMLHEMPGRKIFLQQWVSYHRKRKRLFRREEKDVAGQQPVATREYFPTSFRAAVRQKSRWILGVALQGWRAGWTRSLGSNYFLYRDRKGLLCNLVVIFGYVVVFYWSGITVFNRLSGGRDIPPLIQADEIYFKMTVTVLILFAWRILNRMIATTRVFGFVDGLLAFPRLFVGNFVNFFATVMAIHRYIMARVSGKVPAWGKTEHAWPSEDQMLRYRRRLGDLLMERRMITAAQLEQALSIQKEQAGRLGDILVGMGVLWEEDVLQVAEAQDNREAIEIDPCLHPDCRALVPRELAESERIYPIEQQGRRLILAKQTGHKGLSEEALAERIGHPVFFRQTTSADIDFAIRQGYGNQELPKPGGRLGQRLVDKGILTPKELTTALRHLKRSSKRLGEVLVDLKLITEDALQTHLQEQEGSSL